jgi:CRP/FNR family cyclic AMP-dependent transcriptional regulator
MSTGVTADILKQVEIMNGLSDEQLAQVAAVCREQVFDAGETIVRECESTHELYIIASGSAEVDLSGNCAPSEPQAAAAPRSLISLGRGQVFGEMALVDMGLRSATVRSSSDGTRVFVIDRHDLIGLCEHNTDIGYRVMRNLAADISFKLRHRNLSWR